MNERISSLICDLERISTEYVYERRYIGEAITYLRFLRDIMNKTEEVKQDA